MGDRSRTCSSSLGSLWTQRPRSPCACTRTLMGRKGRSSCSSSTVSKRKSARQTPWDPFYENSRATFLGLILYRRLPKLKPQPPHSWQNQKHIARLLTQETLMTIKYLDMTPYVRAKIITGK